MKQQPSRGAVCKLFDAHTGLSRSPIIILGTAPVGKRCKTQTPCPPLKGAASGELLLLREAQDGMVLCTALSFGGLLDAKRCCLPGTCSGPVPRSLERAALARMRWLSVKVFYPQLKEGAQHKAVQHPTLVK